MAQWNQTDRTLQTKIVYWGPALCGKTTNLQMIHALTDPQGENRLISLNTASDRTLFFDLLPLELGRVFGHTVKIQLYTVPGQVRYDATRRVVLSGADAVVFVADSQPGKGAENRASWENLRGNMKANGLDPVSIPIVVQYNKQDLPGCLPPKDIEASLQSGHTGISASALRGMGVTDTFQRAVLEMLKRLAGPMGRRRVEDSQGLEDQLLRTFETYRQREIAFGSSVSAGGTSRSGPSTHPPGADPDRAGGFPAPSSQDPFAAIGSPSPGGAASTEIGPGGRGPMEESYPDRFGSANRPPAPTAIRFNEEPGGDDLLVRSLRATLGIAEQFGEMRDLKNRLARRIGELEGLQALARELSKRRDAPSILKGLADAALAIPDARAVTVLWRSSDNEPLTAVVLHGLADDPLLSAGGGASPIHELLKRSEPVLLETLPIVGGSIPSESGDLTAALVVPLRPTLKPPGLVVLYGESSFSPEDLRFLGLLASHAAVCIDNAAMTEWLTLYNEKLERDVKARTSQLERANEELRDLDKMKDRFLSSISHEMKTPLTGILSGAELLTTIIPPGNEAHEFVSLVDHEARRLASLVDRILRFHVLGRSKELEESRTVDLLEVLKTVIAEASEKASAREVGIAVDLPEGLSPVVGSRETLVLALHEILDNAIKFSPAAGLIFVEAREELVTPGTSVVETPGDGERVMEQLVVIVVRDLGPGIPRAEQARIFERFEQVGDLLTAKPAGLGLGLPLAREIARRHGGDLTVRSEIGSGSEFRLYLPPAPRTAGSAGLEHALGTTR